MALAITLALTVGGAAGVDRVAAAPDDFAGATACKNCHEPIYRSWAQTAHATGTAWRKTGENDARCRGCHMTGDAPAGASSLAGVQCEACHGAGAAYAADDIMRNPDLRETLGLVPMADAKARAAVCARCHTDSVSIRRFDAVTAWKKIAH